MIIETLPGYDFRRTNWKQKTGARRSPDSITLDNTIYDYGGERFEVSATLPRMTYDEGKPWKAKFSKLKETGRFYLHDQSRQPPPFLLPEMPKPTLINTYAAQDKLIETRGWSGYTDEAGQHLPKAGDYFSIISSVNDEPCFFFLEEDVVVENGDAVLRIFPAVRIEILRGAELDFRNPRGIFTLNSIPDMPCPHDGYYSEFTFSCYQIQ